MYPEQIIQKAIELGKGRSARETLKALRRQKDLENEDMPNERTINRWKKEATILEKQISESAENAREIAKKYWETHPIPKWLQNLYLVKKENGEIKPL